MTPTLTSTPKLYRSAPARGLGQTDGDRVIRDGGDMDAGLIRTVAVLTRGEALGHFAWIDLTMLGQVADAVNAQAKGVKVRFTHPSLSGDGLGKYLGRLKNARLDGDRVLGDLHLAQAAHRTPDGDLAEYVMDMAEVDPDAFGMSIAFEPDYQAERDFVTDHGGSYDPETGAITGFVSPDPENEKDYPHVRLSRLRAVDAVDEPAANPAGLFHSGDEPAFEADALLAYALGLSADRPTTAFDLDPDRVRGFVSRFLHQHQITFTQQEDTMSDETPVAEAEATEQAAADTPETPETPAPGTPETQAEPATEADAQPETPTDTETGVEATIEPVNADAQETPDATELSAPGQQFIDAFGEQQGSIYFAKGLTFEQAQAKHVEALSAENAQLRQRLDQLASDRGVDSPVELSTPTTEPGQDDELVKLTRAFDGDANRAQRVLDMRAAQQK